MARGGTQVVGVVADFRHGRLSYLPTLGVLLPNSVYLSCRIHRSSAPRDAKNQRAGLRRGPREGGWYLKFIMGG